MSTNKKKFFKSASKSTSSETTRSSVKHELKFAPLDQKGFAKQATYKQVKDALLLKIDETITEDLLDVRLCIEMEETIIPPEPTREEPTGDTPAQRKESRERNRIIWESELKRRSRRLYNLDINLLKVRSMIWDKFTSKSMREKIEPLPNYSTVLTKDPVALLKAIKVQMHDTVRSQYTEWTRITALEKLVTFRQHDLSLADYISHFKELRDIFVTQNGTGFNDSYVAERIENFDKYSNDYQGELQAEAYERWIAIIFLKHVDLRRYGTLIDELHSSFARDRNEFPTTLEKAIDLLDTHRLSNKKSTSTDKEKDNGKNKSKPKSADTQKSTHATNLAQSKKSDFKCHCCSSPDHTPSNCPLKSKVD